MWRLLPFLLWLGLLQPLPVPVLEPWSPGLLQTLQLAAPPENLQTGLLVMAAYGGAEKSFFSESYG